MSKAATLKAYLFLFMEIWKDVIGYEGIYQVSNLGNVKSLEREVKNSEKGFRIVKERILKQHLNPNGYLFSMLSNKRTHKTKFIHKLVAESFLDHIPCGLTLVVNHKNFIRTDNKVDNLEIITSRQNASLKNIKSTSIYTGVSFKKGKWESQIGIKGKTIYLGRFDNEIDAANAYIKALNDIS